MSTLDIDRQASTARNAPEVLVIGGGPAGLTAAQALARAGRQVLLVERESHAGGIPRHCAHTGFGIRDLHRVVDGPTYARRLVAATRAAGVTIWTGATVTDWSPDGGATITSADGITTVTPRATILATGARERPRPARLIPGDRPDGVYTTGLLQNLVHLHHQKVGDRAVVLGAELVSWSAVLTLREAGCTTAAMVTHHRRAESYRTLTLAGRTALHVPILTQHRIVRIVGRGHLEAVEVEDLRTLGRRTIPCDTLITTGDWIPDHELARAAGLDIDLASKAPLVDAGLQTSQAGVFAIGNLVHPVDTADVAAIDGRHVEGRVSAWLDGAPTHTATARVVAAGPLQWISPGILDDRSGPPARRRYLAWTDRHVSLPTVTVRQGGKVLSKRRLPWPASPGRIFRIPAQLLDGARPGAGDVVVGVS